jgi:hypothetical protein
MGVAPKTSRAERITRELHADPRWDQAILRARLELGLGELPLTGQERRTWLRDDHLRQPLFDAAWDSLRRLGLSPLRSRLFFNHWVACFLMYPMYLRPRRDIDLRCFRLPANALARLPGYRLPPDERFEHAEHSALVLPSAITAIEFGQEGEGSERVIVIVDATGFPDPEDARRLLRSETARSLRRDWEEHTPPLIQRRRGRPRRRVNRRSSD